MHFDGFMQNGSYNHFAWHPWMAYWLGTYIHVSSTTTICMLYFHSILYVPLLIFCNLKFCQLPNKYFYYKNLNLWILGLIFSPYYIISVAGDFEKKCQKYWKVSRYDNNIIEQSWKHCNKNRNSLLRARSPLTQKWILKLSAADVFNLSDPKRSKE